MAVERWPVVVVRLLSAGVVVMALLAGLVSGAVAGLAEGAEAAVVEEARSPRH